MGNLCRSPLAAALFRHLAEKSGLDIEARSAGLFASHGIPAPWEILQLAEEEGLDLSRHEARGVTLALFNGADLVLVMEPAQRDELHALFGIESGKVRLLSEYSSGTRDDDAIADPYGRSIAHYRTALDEIRESVQGLIGALKRPS
jgi:protein-tyrosine phosphatase